MQAADGAGFWGLGVGDSQSIYPDVYVRLAMARPSLLERRSALGSQTRSPVTLQSPRAPLPALTS